ncbi:MAG: bifunctional pyr operon transcriptional regulator/uracil phosphoribosyltransferase PyrR [Ferruginibacter sp.]
MQILLNPEQLQLTITRLAHQLLEEEQGIEDTVFIGLQPRGIIISDRIIETLKTLNANEVSYGKLDITFYRDDIRSEIHRANQTDISFSIENKTVILIDDVLYTGRTVRAALDAIQAFGRPKAVKLCVLVNRRFSRELPIQPDYCGISIDSNPSQKVKVKKETLEVILYS